MLPVRPSNQKPLDAAMKCKIRGLHSEGRTVREIAAKCNINMALARIYMKRLKLKISEDTQSRAVVNNPAPAARRSYAAGDGSAEAAREVRRNEQKNDYRYDTPDQIVRVARNMVTIQRPATHVPSGSALV